MFSSWDEWNINGCCTVHNNEKCELPAAPAVFVLRTLCQRPAVAVIRPYINQDCKFHRSTLLLNLNSADNVPDIKFNAILKIQTSWMFVYAIL